MEAREILDIQQKLGATQEELARIMRSRRAALSRWEEGSASVPPRKDAILEAVRKLAERLETDRSCMSDGIRATDRLRSVLIEMGAENFLFLLAKENKESLPRSCWRRLAAAIPAMGFLVGAPVGAMGAMCNSPSVLGLLETLRGKKTKDLAGNGESAHAAR